MRLIILVLSAVSILGCETVEDQAKAAKLSEISEGSKSDISAERPVCEVDTVDFELDTHLLAFEMTNKFNIAVGFNLITGFVRGIDLGFQIENAKMLASMHLSQAVQPEESIVNVTGTGKSTKMDFKAGVDLGQLGVDVGYYRQTPLNKLTEKTMKSSLANLQKAFQKIETVWSSRVILSDPVAGEVYIPAGSKAKIRLHDKFKLYNVEYIWRGIPCESELLFVKKKTDFPIAILEVIGLDYDASLLRIIQRVNDDVAIQGAIVEIESLPLAKKEKSRVLSRSVRLGSVQSERLEIPGTPGVDLTLYLREQIQALLPNYNFYIRK